MLDMWFELVSMKIHGFLIDNKQISLFPGSTELPFFPVDFIYDYKLSNLWVEPASMKIHDALMIRVLRRELNNKSWGQFDREQLLWVFYCWASAP